MAQEFDPSIGKATQFQPGKSGNPQGARLGVRYRTQHVFDQILTDAEVRLVLAKVLADAKAGHPYAVNVLLDRAYPRTEIREHEFGDAAEPDALADRLASFAAARRANGSDRSADGSGTPRPAPSDV